MELSLSVRVAESFGNKRVSAIPLDELAGIAAAAGYDALCMRASVVGVHSAAGAAARARRIAAAHGLTVSMVTADFAVPENSCEGPNSLRRITPSLDVAERLGADLIRICMKTEEDVVHAQRAADEAHRRRRVRAQEAARRVPVLMLFPLVFCVLPAFCLLTVVPLLVGTISDLGFPS